MKLHIVSDLHIETRKVYLPVTDADVTVFAGDIGVGIKGIDFAGEHAAATNKPVVYVSGNHEFYYYDMPFVKEMINSWATNELNIKKFHYLDNSECVIEGVRFLGCTLWTNFELFGTEKTQECLSLAGQRLNDFHKIFYGDHIFLPADSLRLHEASVKWLSKKLNEHFDGKTVVVTHHAPSFKSVANHFENNLTSACYASNLEHLIDGKKIALWVHGHMHESFDYMINGTRVVCNPRGYTDRAFVAQNNQYKENLVVEI